MNLPAQPDREPSAGELDVTRAMGDGEPESRLANVLENYLAALQAGESPDRQRLLTDHPDLASQLEGCLSGIEFIHQATRPAAGLPTQLGDFRIVCEVGRGGMGVVYEAEQISLKRRVALKVLRFGAAADSEAMKRFQREAETVAGLHHTNIVPIFAIGCEEGVNYYAMQFIEGRSLAEYQAVNGVPQATFHQVAGWGLQSAEALAHAHHRGVIHRDIKPSNLILDPDGRIWLTDFGLAKRIDDVSLSLAGAILGTPRYMSPEQAAATTNPVDHRTDIYSLGATLYELATGRPLFDADSPHAVITQILTTEPLAPRIVSPNLPRDLETIIVKCLAKEPERRYESAQTLADDLRSFVEGRAIKARRATIAEKVTRWFKQQRRSVGVTAATVAATVAVIAGSLIARQMHTQAQLGFLALHTPRDGEQQAEVAEILTLQDEPVGAPFTLPTKEPVALPAGAYRLRLTAPARLSQDYLFDVTAGQPLKFDVGLVSETVGYPIPLLSPSGVELVQSATSDGGIDLKNSESRMFIGPQDPQRPTLRCYSGYSQLGWKPDGTRETTVPALWEANWSVDSPLVVPFLKTEDDRARWQKVIAWFDVWWYRNGTMPRLVRPARDLDGDGIVDMIWIAPRVMQVGIIPGPTVAHPASLVAVSGKDGRPLWWIGPRAVDGQGALLTTDPLLIEIPGEPLALGCAFRSNTNSEEWIEVILARSGETAWRFRLPSAAAFPQSSTWLTTSKGPDGDLRLVVVSGTQLVVLDVNNGLALPMLPGATSDAAGQPPLLPLRPNEPILDARFADLDGDGVQEVLLTVQTDGRGQQDIAFSIAEQNVLWEVPSSFEVGAYHMNEGRHAWPLLEDLDGDHNPEVILPGIREEGSIVFDGCRVLDGRTGKARWSRRFPRTFGGRPARRPEQFVSGPDLNADGVREVIMVSVRNEFRPHSVGQSAAFQYEQYFLYVDCFSGKDGTSLWWQRLPLGLSEHAAWTGRPATPIWWQRDEQGWPMLVVPVHRHSDMDPNSGTHSIYVLSARTGRIEHQADDVAFPTQVDWNNDSLSDLAVYIPDDPLRFASRNHYPDRPSGKFVALRGSPPEAFRRLGPWVEEQDFDGDGIAELSQRTHGPDNYAVQIISGADGRMKSRWRTEWPETPRSFTVGELSSARAPLGDFDGDGLADLLIHRDSHFWDFQPQSLVATGKLPLLVQAVSGKTGKRIWGGGSFPLPPAFRPLDADERSKAWEAARMNHLQPMSTQVVDLDGDAHAELLQTLQMTGQHFPEQGVSVRVDQRQQFIALLDGRDGSLRWAEPITELASDNSHSPPGRSQVDATTDLNGDGTRDIVLVLPKQNVQGWWTGEIQVRNGRDGKAIWGPVVLDGQWTNFSDIATLLLGDLDGDGRAEIIVMESTKPNLRVLRGDTGDVAWTWQATNNQTQMKPNFVLVDRSPVNPDSTVKPTSAARLYGVAVVTYETSNNPELVILDHTGQVVERIGCQSNQLWSHDLDGDGRVELLRPIDNKITATRGLHDVVWNWSIPPFGYGTISHFETAADGRVFVQISGGDSLTILDGGTGKAVGRTWKSTNTVVHENERLVDLSRPGLMPAKGLPRLLTRVGDGPLLLGHVVSRMMLPARTDGSYDGDDQSTRSQPAQAETTRLATSGDDPRLVRQLPWAPSPAEWAASGSNMIRELAKALGLAFAVILIPFWLIRAGVRRRELGAWRGGLIAAGLVCIITVLWLVRFAPPGSHWRDAPMALPLAVALGALPILIWISAVIRSLFAGHWRKMCWIVGTSLAAAGILAGIILWRELPRKPVELHYSWFAWWFILLLGGYAVGWLLLIWRGIRPAVIFLRTKIRARLARHARPIV